MPSCPITKLGYQGSEPDAAWRKAAEARIEQIRKGDLTVAVKDAAGKPVRNAEVAVRMKKHAFLFGTAVSGAAFSGGRMTPENLAKYKEEILEAIQFRGDGKRDQVAAMGQRSLPPRYAGGHRLASRERTPGSRPQPGVALLEQHQREGRAGCPRTTPPRWPRSSLDHIAETTTALHGRLVDWDVINETFTNHDFMDILGRHAMVDWFKAARAGDPDAKLFINDFNILEGDDQAAPGRLRGDHSVPDRPGSAASMESGCKAISRRASRRMDDLHEAVRPFRGVRQSSWRSRNSISTRRTKPRRPITLATS